MKQPAMHPTARAFIDKMIEMGPTPLHQLSAPNARVAFEERILRTLAPPLVNCQTENRTIDGAQVRLYHPPETGTDVKPVILYFHGGGWVVGDLEMVDPLCHDLCALSGATVISVDYRLAPEHPFPAPLDDGIKVLDWVRDYADHLQIDPKAVFVAGDSAGGNIAAVLALLQANAGKHLAGQMLIYPVTDISREHNSMRTFATGLNLDAATMAWFADAYQPDPALRSDWRVSPLLAPLTTLPAPALVITAGYDPLVDEGAAYAEHLAQAGTPVEYLCFATQIHGFANQTTLGQDPYLLRDVVAGFVRRRHKKTKA